MSDWFFQVILCSIFFVAEASGLLMPFRPTFSFGRRCQLPGTKQWSFSPLADGSTRSAPVSRWKKDLNLGERCRYDYMTLHDHCQHLLLKFWRLRKPQSKIRWRRESAFEAFGAVPPGHSGKPERSLTLDLSGKCLTECQQPDQLA